MEDDAPKENPENPAPDFNKLDLSQLQGFSFGTQWTQDKSSPSQRHDREGGGDRPRREGGAPERRDRRVFRRPSGGDAGPPAGAPTGGAGVGAPERREFNRGPRREGGEFRGGPRRDSRGGDFQGYGGRRDSMERGPYESPYYTVTFYPEDTSFNTLVQTIRKSCRTIELFEIARTVVAKPDRFVVVLAHKSATGAGDQAAPAPAATAEPSARSKPSFSISVPDGVPFDSDEAAIAYVLSKHLDKFFEMAEVEVEAPKGNFQVINRCGITGDLLGPPNYHRYNQIVQQHYTAKVAGRMSIEAFRSRIETVRDPEVVNQWLAQMRKTTRYTWKQVTKPAAAPAQPTPTPVATETAPATEPAAPEAPVATPVSTVPAFDTLEDARTYLLSHARDKVVRTVENARFHGKVLEQIPPGEIRRSVEGALDRQRRFPLDTANALRGRLRREHFTIFKKGSKGVSYVCAVKRKFRVPGQTFSDSIGSLISFIEGNPMVRASELPHKFLGISVAIGRAPEAGAPTAGADAGAKPAAVSEPGKPESSLTVEERAKIARMQGDLMWLVREGYVTEFIDGRLFAPPPMVEARKREVEASEHDPENFPDAPPTAAGAATEPKSADEAPVTPPSAAPAESSAEVSEPPSPEQSQSDTPAS
jgi:hypothetical protein